MANEVSGVSLDINDFLTGLALALVIEGLVYALFPEAMRRVMAVALMTPRSTFRSFGLAMLTSGVFFVWLIRG